MDGEDLADVMQDAPELIFEYKKLKTNIEAYFLDQKNQIPACTEYSFHSAQIRPWTTEVKQRHLWVWSAMPNMGKTTHLFKHAETYRCSWYNYAEKYQNIKPDTQFLLMDEYSTAHLTFTQLNQMCDGTYQYPTKHGNPVQPKLTIILCSNRPIHMVYPNMFQLVEARF